MKMSSLAFMHAFNLWLIPAESFLPPFLLMLLVVLSPLKHLFLLLWLRILFLLLLLPLIVLLLLLFLLLLLVLVAQKWWDSLAINTRFISRADLNRVVDLVFLYHLLSLCIKIQGISRSY